MKGYIDVGFQRDKDYSKLQSGWEFVLNGGALTWKSSKQETTAGFTYESKYIDTSEASKEDT